MFWGPQDILSIVAKTNSMTLVKGRWVLEDGHKETALPDGSRSV